MDGDETVLIATCFFAFLGILGMIRLAWLAGEALLKYLAH
jgi:hypothetical protein